MTLVQESTDLEELIQTKPECDHDECHDLAEYLLECRDRRQTEWHRNSRVCVYHKAIISINWAAHQAKLATGYFICIPHDALITDLRFVPL